MPQTTTRLSGCAVDQFAKYPEFGKLGGCNLKKAVVK
jgi:hypothetical protein